MLQSHNNDHHHHYPHRHIHSDYRAPLLYVNNERDAERVTVALPQQITILLSIAMEQDVNKEMASCGVFSECKFCSVQKVVRNV